MADTVPCRKRTRFHGDCSKTVENIPISQEPKIEPGSQGGGFKYKKLKEKEIRILVILPHEWQEAKGPLMCRFEHVTLDDDSPRPDYEALSYSWGTGIEKRPIRIYDRRPEDKNSVAHPFKVSKRLDSALRCLRYKNKERRVWADALCINQDNPDEKAQQVPRMREIYNGASNVCVWLGEKDQNDSEQVFRFIRMLLKLERLDQLIQDPIHTRNWRALGALMRRSWFSRRWCVQEIALARKATVYCGSKTIDWNDFADAVSLYEERREDIVRVLTTHEKQVARAKRWLTIKVQAIGAHSLVKMLENLCRRAIDGQPSESLMSIGALVSLLPSYDVTDPKDAIYAVMSLAKDTADNKSAIKVNYKVPTLQVYREFFQLVIKSSGSLDFICTPWSATHERPENGRKGQPIILPSWITPRDKRPFSQGDQETADLCGPFLRENADTLASMAEPKTYRASGNVTIGELEILKPDQRLRVSGRYIGDIAHLEKAVEDGKVPLDWLRKVVEIEKGKAAAKEEAIRIEPYDYSSDDGYWTASGTEDHKAYQGRRKQEHELAYIPDSFWRLLVADRGQNGTNPPGWYKRVCQKLFTRTDDPNHHRTRVDYVATEIAIFNAMHNFKKSVDRPTIEFLRRVQAATWNKKLMVTKGNSIGLVPEGSQEGDIICLLWGCSVPVVLRKVDNNRFTLIGECYVHGIMNGEFMYKHPGIEKLKEDRFNRMFDIV